MTDLHFKAEKKSAGHYFEGLKLLCPVCGFDYVHFGKPSNAIDAWQGRGNAIQIPMYCEESHYWTVLIGHSKGQSYIEIRDAHERTPIGNNVNPGVTGVGE